MAAPLNPQTEKDWIECIPLPAYLAKIPAGHIISIVGEEIWIDGNGTQFSTESYKKMHGVDPAIVWKAKKAYLKEHGRGVHYTE